MPRKKKTFDLAKEVKAIARERVGRVPAAENHPAQIFPQEAETQVALRGRELGRHPPMFLFDFFRSFLPLHNPIGFGAGRLHRAGAGGAAGFAGAAAAPGLSLRFQRLAARTGWSMLLLAALPVALRLLLLPRHPVPTPAGADSFSYLLLADTLRHFRLANPPHALPQFFETVFVLQDPSYSSIYPLGQGLALALGWTIFGHPWAGVVLSVAALCSLCYWMLRGWTTPGWALAGGLLAVIEFGPLNEWMNIYWGGAVAAAAGCLVFGALPRLRHQAAHARRGLVGPRPGDPSAHPAV